MKPSQVFRLTAIGVAMLGAGSVLAEDLSSPTDPAQQREKMHGMSSEERTAQRDQMREQMQERMRNMTPEEQQLMRETRSDGRDRMENQQAEGTRQRSRDGKGQGRGKGGGMGGGRPV